MGKDLLKEYCENIKNYIKKDFKKHFHEPVEGLLKYPFVTSGINYATQVWDWGSYLFTLVMNEVDIFDLERYQKGNVLNFLDHQDELGRIPLVVSSVDSFWPPKLDENYHFNIHKPVLSIHIVAVSERYHDYLWIKPYYPQIKKYIAYYENNLKDEESGLFLMQDDMAIGIDNDPAVFYKQDKTVGFILYNSLMYEEYLSLAKIAKALNFIDDYKQYQNKAELLKKAIQEECYDPIDGYFYSVDLSLKKIDSTQWLHSGQPRYWHSLPIKIKSVAGIMPLAFAIANEEQAKRVIDNYLNPQTLYSEYGIRSLAKNEKMYGIYDSGNPSCWLGPIWVNTNYFLYEGLKKYGYSDLATDLAKKTIMMLGRDLKENGGFHEYYDPETGKGVRGLGMHGWNFLVLKMIKDLEK